MAVSWYDRESNRIEIDGIKTSQVKALKVSLAAGCFALAAIVSGNNVGVAAGGVATIFLEADVILKAYLDTIEQVQTLRE